MSTINVYKYGFVNFMVVILITLFSYSGITKTISYHEFTNQLLQSPILEPFSFLLTWLVPIVEFLIVVFLIVGRTRLIGLYSAAVLLLIFTAYLFNILSYDFFIPCSCGGWLEKLPLEVHISLNVLLIVLTVISILLSMQTRFKRKSIFP